MIGSALYLEFGFGTPFYSVGAVGLICSIFLFLLFNYGDVDFNQYEELNSNTNGYVNRVGWGNFAPNILGHFEDHSPWSRVLLQRNSKKSL